MATNFVCPSFGAFEVAPQPWYSKVKTILQGGEVRPLPHNLPIPKARHAVFIVPREKTKKEANPGITIFDDSSRAFPRSSPGCAEAFSDIDDDEDIPSMRSFVSHPVKRPPPEGSWRDKVRALSDTYTGRTAVRQQSLCARPARPSLLMPSRGGISRDDFFSLPGEESSEGDLSRMHNMAVEHLERMIRTVLPEEYRERWERVLCRLAWMGAQRVHACSILTLDVMSSIHILSVPNVGTADDCEYVPGICFKKHVSDNRMTKTKANGTILLLEGSVDVDRTGHVVELEDYMPTHIRSTEVLFNIISRWQPDVVFVEYNMHHYIISNLFLQGITVATFVNRSILEKVSASTGASIINLDNVLTEINLRGIEILPTELSPCGTFKLFHAFSDVSPPIIYVVPHEFELKEKSKTISQATMVLRGAPIETLRVMKRHLTFFSQVAYNLHLETHVYKDFQMCLPDSLPPHPEPFVTSSMHRSPMVSPPPNPDVDWEQFVEKGALEPICHQSIIFHRTRCYVDAPKPSVEKAEEATAVNGSTMRNVDFQLCTVAFYDRMNNDTTLTEALQEWYNQMFSDDKENPKLSVMHFAHNLGVVSVRPSIQEEKVSSGCITLWTTCTKCKVNSDRRLLSPFTQRYSFGKFLENFFYNTLAMKTCGHSLFRDSIVNFARSPDIPGFPTAVVSMQYKRETTMTITRPPLVCQGDHSYPETMFADEINELKDITHESFQSLRKVFEDIQTAQSKLFVMYSSQTEERLKQFQELIQAKLALTVEREEVMHSRLVDYISAKDFLAFNHYRNALYLELKDWNRHVGEVWALYLSPELQGPSRQPSIRGVLDILDNTVGELAAEPTTLLRRLTSDSDFSPSLRSNRSSISMSGKRTGKFATPSVQFPEKLVSPLGTTHLCCGLGVDGVHVIVRDTEPTSLIAFALISVDHQDFLKDPTQAPRKNTMQTTSSHTLAHGEASPPRELPSAGMPSREASNEDLNAKDNSPNSPTPTNSPVPYHHHRQWSGDPTKASDIAGSYTSETSLQSSFRNRQSFNGTTLPSTQPPPLHNTAVPIKNCSPEQVLQFYGLLCDRGQLNFRYQFSDKDTGTNFTCTAYYARQFSGLRMLYLGGDERPLITSLSRSMAFVPSGGKSGSTFVKTKDERYILKQVSQAEMWHFLETFAPEYFTHMACIYSGHYDSAVAKVLGAYKLTTRSKGRGTIHVDYILMENVFYGRRISRVYDLKGSLRNRLADSTTRVMMDENLLNAIERQKWIYVNEWDKERLNLALHYDTLLLSLQRIMDYSLLVAVDEADGTVVCGIVDYFREYDLKKQMEFYLKSGASGGKQPTIVSPRQYKRRFQSAMSNFFPLLPNKLSPWLCHYLYLWPDSLTDSGREGTRGSSPQDITVNGRLMV